MNRPPRALRLCAVLAALLMVPQALATHHVGDRPEMSGAPEVPQTLAPEPGIPVVDRRLAEIGAALAQANETVGTQYDVVNQTYKDAQDKTPHQPVQLFFDGAGLAETGDDASVGGRGAWTVLGTTDWARLERLGRTGNASFTSAALADGTYSGGANSLLLSPAIELRTGLADPTLQAQQKTLKPLIDLCRSIGGAPAGFACDAEGASVSAVYETIWTVVNQQVTDRQTDNLAATETRQFGINVYDPGDAVYQLEFAARYNLAIEEDQVQVFVFNGATPPPAVVTPQQCKTMVLPSCTLMSPVEGYSGQGAPALLDDPNKFGCLRSCFGAFTGFSDWNTYHLDLTHWAERHEYVWVGFAFKSEPHGSRKFFENERLFATRAGFFGFELDDLRVTAPSPPESIRVREPLEPSFRIPGTDAAVVAPGEPPLIAADIVNTGQSEAHVYGRIVVRRVEDLKIVGTAFAQSGVLQPGSILHVRHTMPILPVGEYTATIFAERLNPSALFSDADPTDNFAQIRFDVTSRARIGLGDLLVAEPSIISSETETVSLSLTNFGNTVAEVTLLAEIIDMERGELVNNAVGSFLLVNEASQTISLAGKTKATATWHVKGARPGQYALFVRTLDGPEFHPDLLQNELVRPLTPQFRDPLRAPIPSASDATLAKWEGVPSYDLPDTLVTAPGAPGLGAWMQLINTNTSLFVLVGQEKCQGCPTPGGVLDAYFDDAADGVATQGAEDSVNFTTTEGLPLDGHWDEEALEWRLDEGAEGWFRTYEDEARRVTVFARPINSTDPQDLQASAGEDVGMMLRFLVGERLVSHPQGATPTDGEGLVPADQTLSDELRAWRRIHLAGSARPLLGYSALSSGFGVDRSPGPIFQADFGSCAAAAGWTETGRVKESVSSPVDSWNCDRYAPDGHVHVFQGARPGTCPTAPCNPWTVRGNEHDIYPAELLSPPVFIGNAPVPYLLVHHQYSSFVQVDDPSAVANGPNRGINVNQRFTVALEQWDEKSRSWSAPVLLRPDGGYDTEQTAGLYDPTKGPREFANYCHVPGGVKGRYDERCGWWVPAGYVPHQRIGDLKPYGASHTGSPWQVSRVPLSGDPFGDNHALDVRGKFVRFVFTSYRAGPGDSEFPEPFKDFGWRIAGVYVTDEQTQMRDLAVEDVRLGPSSFDAASIGIGPGTTVQVNVTVRNRGTLDVQRANVQVRGLEVDTGLKLCEGLSSITTALSSGDERTVSIPCRFTSGAAGLVRFVAASSSPEGDDVLSDNAKIGAEIFGVRAVPDVGVSLGSSATSGPARSFRPVDLRISNQGNVPVTGLTVTRALVRQDQQGQSDLLQSRMWRFEGTIDVGASLSIFDPALRPSTDTPITSQDARFFLASTGLYDVVARIQADADQDASNDVAALQLAANVQMYFDDFDHPVFTDPAVVAVGDVANASDASWSVQPDAHAGTDGLLVGDPRTEELALSTDTTYTLPLLQLMTAKSASLSIVHQYSLEESYDAARVEISTDGGAQWRPLRPVENAAGGLPNGYPDVPLLGATALLDDVSGTSGQAFTGDSTDLAGADDGWLSTTFDLSSDPEFRRFADFDAFSLADLDSEPDTSSTRDGATQFRSNSWIIDEPAAEERQRYWWVQNLAFDEPAPASGDLMWWSGSFGEFPPGTPIDSELAFNFTQAMEAVPADIAAPVWIRWWDWRAGWQDAGPTGVSAASFTVRLVGPGLDVSPTVVTDVVRPDGWNHHRVDASQFVERMGELRLRYTTAPEDSKTKNNRGVFIDDIDIVAGPVDARGGLVGPVSVLPTITFEQAQDADHFTASQLGGDPGSGWQIVGRGASSASHGWHVESATDTPRGTENVWRFGKPSQPGYPNNADTRLVTPVVDLGKAVGNAAVLRFDHRYEFESDTSQCTGACFTRAIDAGVVEYQVMDQAGRFGPWRQLAATPGGPPKDLLFASDKTLLDASERSRLLASGYPALERRDQGGFCEIAPNAHGYSFERYVGHLAAPDPKVSTCPWVQRPYSVVFSGASQGWEHVEWPLAELAGKKVRFGFHAATDPRQGGVKPLHGWSVSDIAVSGDVFQGKATLLRLRLATDESISKGRWFIDDVGLVGDRYGQLVILDTSSARIARAAPGTVVDFYANVTNLGSQSRPGIALAFGGAQDVQILSPTSMPDLPDSSLPPGFTTGFGPVTLFPGGETGSRIPIHARIVSPADGLEKTIRVAVLERDPATQEYGSPRNEVTGTTSDAWRVRSTIEPAFEVVAPLQEDPGLLVREPVLGGVGTRFNFTSAVRNDGTTAPMLSARWTFAEVLRRNSQDPGKELISVSATSTPSMGAFPPGARVQSTANFTPPKAGLYRATVEFLADGAPTGATARLEFLIDTKGEYLRTDFTTEVAEQKGWRDASPQASDRTGGSPPEIRFRQVDGRYVWGITDQMVLEGRDYCSFGGCNYQAGQSPQTVHGLEGVAESRLIDLTRVPQGQAVLTLDHSYVFTHPGDGARVEAMLYDPATMHDAFPTPAFLCTDAEGNQFPETFVLVPEEPMGGEAVSADEIFVPGVPQGASSTPPEWVPKRVNVLAGEPPATAPVFGGPPILRRVDRFDLSQPPAPTCPSRSPSSPAPLSVVDYPMRLLLRVGTQPGSQGPLTDDAYLRDGQQGWKIRAISVTSSGVLLSPDEVTVRLIDGAAKRYVVSLTNLGQVPDRVRLSVDPVLSRLPDLGWVSFPEPEVALAPGETRRVEYAVTIPADPSLSRGTYPAVLVARSSLDPSTYDAMTVRLSLQPNPLPDLTLSIALGAAELNGMLEEGRVVPVFATVFNKGQADARPVRLSVVAEDLSSGTQAQVGSVAIPDLCAPSRVASGLCRGVSSTSVFVEWLTPPKPGLYRLVAVADPDARIIEERLDNNIASFDVTVIPVRQPDLAVLGIRVEGEGRDGFVQEGDLMTVTVAVTNLGSATARQVNVQILMGSTQLADRQFDALSSGFVLNVTASTLAVRGEHIVKAIAFPLGDSGVDPNPANNEFKRLVRVRAHELSAQGGQVPAVDAGGVADAILTVQNKANSVERVMCIVDPMQPEGWTVSAAPAPLSVAPGTNASLSLRIGAPESAPAGLNRVRLLLIDASTGAALSNATVFVNVRASDTAPLILAKNVTLEPGARTLGLGVTNRANKAMNLSVQVATPAWGGAPVLVRLAASEHRSVNVSLDVPSTTPPGMYEVVIQARETAALKASAVAFVTVSEAPRATFAWRNVTREAGDRVGQHVLAMGFRIENTGNLPFTHTLYPPLVAGHALSPFVDEVSVSPGRVRQGLWRLSIPDSVSLGGLGPVEAWITVGGNESRLAAALALPDPNAGPNLRIDEVSVLPGTNVTQGSPVRMQVRIANRGLVASPVTWTFAYVDGALADVKQLRPLRPGEQVLVSYNWTLAEAGERLVVFVANANASTPEVLRDDNSASLVIDVRGRDLGAGLGGFAPGPSGIVTLAAMSLLVAVLRVARRRR